MLTALSLTKASTAPCVQVSTGPLFLLWEDRTRRQLRDNKPTPSILEHFAGTPNLQHGHSHENMWGLTTTNLIMMKKGGGACNNQHMLLLLLLLSRFSRVRLCVTPETAAHQAPPSLGFSRQEHWSGLPFPPPMHESEKWKWSLSFVSDS